MAAVQRSIEIAVPPEEFFKVVSDYKNYGQFLDEIRDVKLGRRDGNRVEVTYTIEVDAGIAKKAITYTLAHVEAPPSSMKWTMVKGEMMKSNEGGWSIKEAGPGKTLAEYSIEIGFGLLVPKSVAGFLTERNLPKMLEAFKKRAESIRK